MEKTIVTVLGKDTTGIIAKVTTYLANSESNILDISQTIVDGYFNMILIADTSKANIPIVQIKNELKKLGEDIGVQISVQKEEIFEKMHRI